MPIRLRDFFYALALYALVIFAALAVIAWTARPTAAQGVTWPAPVVAGGAMPVQWNGISDPTPWDWVGLYFPEGGDRDYIEWIYVSCSQTPVVPRSTGTCGFVIPSTVPPGVYEIRLYYADGFTRLATSPHIEVLDGGWR